MLKEEIKKRCTDEPELFAEICKVTGKNPNACLQFLNRNSSMELRSFEVLTVIKRYTGLNEIDILEIIAPVSIAQELQESDVHNK